MPPGMGVLVMGMFANTNVGNKSNKKLIIFNFINL
jgi:hypothetical protein